VNAYSFKGTGSAELILGPGEAVFYKIAGVSLVEDRKQRGHYESRSSGISVPLGPVRYRVGQSRGQYVQGPSRHGHRFRNSTHNQQAGDQRSTTPPNLTPRPETLTDYP
jgi:hypothetical protein